MGQNETQRHFELRNLDKDMEQASAEAFRVSPKEHARRLRSENRFLLLFLALVIGVSCLALGVF
ncbi:hypothetical protein CO670_03420 [Rhizobium sp. J15]|uniref:hypothetical protein n=1 Tax=Rhizobium sp. J15 TaxID=2035450 RepID=UPI000BE8FFEF|nr:hypothetical protein [Rhizobium sp. J15]PDT18470.1 hypothetical protein CO670_03420 [Rhizobium sp. J15]